MLGVINVRKGAAWPWTRRDALRGLLVLLAFGACTPLETSTYVEPDAPAGLEAEVEATRDDQRLWQVRLSGDSAGAIREGLADLMPEVRALVAGGDAARDFLLEALKGEHGYSRDLSRAIYAAALGEMGDASALVGLRTFVAENLLGDLLWAPHLATDAILKLEGAPRSASGAYSMLQMQAVARIDPITGGRQVTSSGLPLLCGRQYVLVGADGEALTLPNGEAAVVHGVEHWRGRLPDSVRDNYLEAVPGGGGVYVTDDPVYPGEPDRRFNCAGYAFRRFNGGQPWTADPAAMFEVLVATGALEVITDEDAAQPGDVVFYYREGQDLPGHVAEVHTVDAGLLGADITVRNADGQSGLFDAAIDASYFTGDFFGFGARYPRRAVYRWKGGAPPQVAPDPAFENNHASCNARDAEPEPADPAADSGTAGAGSLAVTLRIGGRNVPFSAGLHIFSDEGGVTGDIAIPNTPVLAAFVNPQDYFAGLIQVAFDPRAIGGAGQYAVADPFVVFEEQGAQVSLYLTVGEHKNADGTPVTFLATGGSADLSAWPSAKGEALRGSVTANLEGEREVGEDAEGEPIIEILQGSVTLTFDTPLR